MKSITLPAGHAIEMASASDRKWFKRNPHRTYRMRPAIPGEFLENANGVDPAKFTLWTVVKQIEPGVRFRLGLYVKREAEPVDADWTIGPLFNRRFDCFKDRAIGMADDWSAVGDAVMQAFVPPRHVLKSNVGGDVR